MKIYLSYAYDEQFNAVGYPHPLIAFPYDKTRRFLDRLSYRPESVLTDSGAWSAWTIGERIRLDDYLDWILYFRAHPRSVPCVHINLDVIPGDRGRPANAREKREGIEESLRNADRMRSLGLPIMEVHHQLEPWDYLNTLVDRLRPGDLLGIAPRKDQPVQARRAYCSAVFRILLDAHGKDRLPPCHGLGVTGSLIGQFPWWSVDTSSWVQPSKYGKVTRRAGRMVYEPRMRGNTALRGAELLSLLRRWRDRGQDLTRLWDRRGIRFQPDPEERSQAA